METSERIELFKELFEEKYKDKILQNIQQSKKRVVIEFLDIAKKNSDLANDLIEEPEEVIKEAEVAIESLDVLGEVRGIKVRVRGELFGQKVRIRDLRARHLNKFITVEGTIETKTDVVHKITCLKYECNSCGNVMNILQLGDVIKEPTKCSCGKKGAFRQRGKELMDCFSIRLQELPNSIMFGSDLKTLLILCQHDLADSIIEERLIEGLKITVNGIYTEKINPKKTLQVISYLDANYIKISDETYYDIELSEKDILEIRQFALKNKENLIDIFSEKLFQGVYGYKNIKTSLVLQAFGGTSNYEAVPKIRGDIHIALVGDAGLNKTAFMQYVCSFTPKARMAVGTNVSGVGICGTVIKDELTGTWAVKPGILPLSNGGAAIVDELDKMPFEERDVLLEPMESQTVTIDKADKHRTMLARASLLVSMNPKKGYFNNYVPIYDQVDLTPALISRFDIIHIMRKDRTKNEKARNDEEDKARMILTRSSDNQQDELKRFHIFTRKYVAYAKQKITPKISDSIRTDYLPKLYADFDYKKRSNDEVKNEFPFTPRQLFNITRLAEARARMYLRNEVLIEDLQYAIMKVNDCLKELIPDQYGKIDEEMVLDGVSSQTKKLHEVWDGLVEKLQVDNLVDRGVFEDELEAMGFSSGEIERMFDNKKKYGDIIFPRGERNNFLRLR